MHALGTTHVLLNPIDGTNRYVDRLFAHFFNCQTFPERKDWEVFHIAPPSNEEMDYRVDMNWDRIYVSWDNVDSYTCCNTERIQDGYEEVQVWNEQDSAFVTQRNPIYKDVSVTVNSYNQNKYAQINLFCDVINLETQQLENSFSINQQENWANEYSEVCGDERALSLLCNDSGGYKAFFPNDWEMLRNASYDLNRRFNCVIDNKVN